MFYLANKVSGIIASTREFLARGLNAFTIARISDVGVFARPLEHQLAYDGYKANLECFLTATALQKKVSCTTEHCPFPSGYTITAPIPIPRVVFTLKGPLTEEQVTKFEQAYESSGLLKIKTKAEHTYTLEAPTLDQIRKLKKGSTPRSINLDGYAQISGAYVMLPVLCMMDAFLSTHTYSFRRSDVDPNTESSEPFVPAAEIRNEAMYYRPGHKKASDTKYKDLDEGKRYKWREDDKEDLTPWLSCRIPNSMPVLVAKPSRKPSKTSWGLPKEVPNKPGLLFPYFQGMLTDDTKGVRAMITSLFFRCLGDEMTNPRDAYLDIKQHIGSVSNTPQGLVLSHILKGMELGMDAQAQTFLLFDKAQYMGFVLLGEEFKVHFNGWHTPLSADELQAELAQLLTHDSALDALAAALSRCQMLNSSVQLDYSREDIDTSDDLCDTLSKVDRKESSKADIELVEQLLKNLSFPGTYRKLNPENVQWAIEQFAARLHDFGNEKIFIHPKDWSQMGTTTYKVMGCFGAQAFSFIDPRGDSITVPINSFEKDFFAKAVVDKMRLPIYEKNLSSCVHDWNCFLGNRTVKLMLKERAIGSRALVVVGEKVVPIWDALKKVAKSIEGGKDKGKGKAAQQSGPSTSKKQKSEEPGSFDDLF